MATSQNWADLIGKGAAYVVLRKGNRLQVVVQPTDKQLRRRGKRNWQVVTAGVPGRAPFEVSDELRDAVLEGLMGLTSDDRSQRRRVESSDRKKKVKA